MGLEKKVESEYITVEDVGYMLTPITFTPYMFRIRAGLGKRRIYQDGDSFSVIPT